MCWNIKRLKRSFKSHKNPHHAISFSKVGQMKQNKNSVFRDSWKDFQFSKTKIDRRRQLSLSVLHDNRKNAKRHTRRIPVWDNTDSEWLSGVNVSLKDGHNCHLVLRLQKPERRQWLRQVWASFWHATQRSYTQVALWWWSCHPLSLEFTFTQGQPVKEPIRIQPALGHTGVWLSRWSWFCWIRWLCKFSANVCCILVSITTLCTCSLAVCLILPRGPEQYPLTPRKRMWLSFPILAQ